MQTHKNIHCMGHGPKYSDLHHLTFTGKCIVILIQLAIWLTVPTSFISCRIFWGWHYKSYTPWTSKSNHYFRFYRFSSIFYHQSSGGATCKWSYLDGEIDMVILTPWTSKSVHYLRFYRQEQDGSLVSFLPPGRWWCHLQIILSC